MWISRERSPLIVTAPTPSTDSSARFTCLSAISVSVRRLALVLESMRLMIGSASGSCFWMTGGSISGGTVRIAPATFSRTALAASSRSRSRTNRIWMLAVPPVLTFAVIWSMPAMPLRAFSIGMMTADVISSGEAPGSRSCTLTWAGSAFGKRSTPRSRNEKMPSTTSDITSIVAKTGRRTQSSDSMATLLRRPRSSSRRSAYRRRSPPRDPPCSIRRGSPCGRRRGRPS